MRSIRMNLRRLGSWVWAAPLAGLVSAGESSPERFFAPPRPLHEALHGTTVFPADRLQRLPPVEDRSAPFSSRPLREKRGVDSLIPPVGEWFSMPRLLEPPPMPAASQPSTAPPSSANERTDDEAAFDVVARHANELIDHGAALALRRAYFSARAEFIAALELIAQARDAGESSGAGRGHCAEALASGLVALAEADDFVSRNGRLSAEIDVSRVVSGHRTPVLRGAESVSPLVARQQYYTFAQERLKLAGGQSASAARALVGLGKVAMLDAGGGTREYLAHAPKALAAYYAASQIDANDSLAANELGVLLARFGRLNEAVAALRHSLSVKPTAETWHNLASVHEQLGERDLAEQARQQVRGETIPPSSRTEPHVVWLTPAQFARTSRPSGQAAIDDTQSAIQLCGGFVPLAKLNASCATCGPVETVLPSPASPPFGAYGHGEYVGPHRLPHLPEYRLRVDDQLDFVYRLTRDEMAGPYRLNVGDTIAIESLADVNINRGGVTPGQGLVIQPDGTITLHLLGQVRAARLTIDELREELTQQYRKFYKDPQITVTPLRVNTKLEDLRSAIDNRFGAGGQTRSARITPEGTIQLPAIGNVPAQGLTLDELKREVDERYLRIVDGIEITPVLVNRAPRHVFVVGEVVQSGRHTLEGPTTVMQSIALAGGWNIGAGLRQIVVFRRTEDWQLIATRLDVRDALLGRKPCEADEIWLRDSDLVIVPKSHIKLTGDLIQLVFTRGIYGVIPLNVGMSIATRSTL